MTITKFRLSLNQRLAASGIAMTMVLTGCAADVSRPSMTKQALLFSRLKPDPNRIGLTAAIEGTFEISTNCVGIRANGEFHPVVWPETAELLTDGKVVVRDRSSKREWRSGQKIRLGGAIAISAPETEIDSSDILKCQGRVFVASNFGS